MAGLDGFYTKIKGKEAGLMVLLDMGDGQPVELAEVAKVNPEKPLNGCCPWPSVMG